MGDSAYASDSNDIGGMRVKKKREKLLDKPVPHQIGLCEEDIAEDMNELNQVRNILIISLIKRLTVFSSLVDSQESVRRLNASTADRSGVRL
jgi:hypothetical protein